MLKKGIAACAIGLSLAPLMAGAASAQTAEEFYKNSKITIVIGFAPGGGYDAYARLAARHMSKYLPSNPLIVPQNMPLAGGLIAANFLYEIAARDGSVIGALANNIMEQQILDGEGIKYDATKFNWIGRLNIMNEAQVVWREAGVNTIAEALIRTAVVGASGPTATPTIYPRVLNNIIGAKFKIVTGYKGAPESCLAMEKGEVGGCMIDLGLVRNTKKHWTAENKVSILYQMASEPDPDFPGVPTYSSLGRNNDEKQMLSIYSFSSDVGRSILAPPGVPSQRIAILREAFDRTTQDPEFREDAKRSFLELSTKSGAFLQRIVEDAGALSPEVVARAKAAREAK